MNTMKSHISIEELSAFLDGEASDVSSLEAHLESCDHCRDRVAALKHDVSLLQSIPEPEVHPAFVARVIATIKEQESTRGRFSIPRWVYGLIPAGVAAALILVVVMDDAPDTRQNTAEISAEDRVAAILQQDEEELFDQLTMRFAEDASEGSFASGAYDVSTPQPAVPDETMLSLALSDSKNLMVVNHEWSDTKDLRTTISQLTADESDLFKQMLKAHAQEAILGEAAFKG